ncbi:unnamed protein product [Linum tenue]|uniref:Uncharacterized protein n=1 Tax=Linum tenue TaxID=586396 RepID=A0AAV0H9I6_9ROSI|nr:unnamed protein product [Linum tenue]
MARRQSPRFRLPAPHPPDHLDPRRQPLPRLPPQAPLPAQGHRRDRRRDPPRAVGVRPEPPLHAPGLPQVERPDPRVRRQHRPPLLPLPRRPRARALLHPPQRQPRLRHRRRRDHPPSPASPILESSPSPFSPRLAACRRALPPVAATPPGSRSVSMEKGERRRRRPMLADG